MIVIPAVSRIEKDWATGRVLRLNMIATINEGFAEKMEVTDTPTFILFDTEGRELERWVRDAPPVEDLP